MNTRKLQDNREVQELENPITMKVYTKCPEKWLLIDLETGEHYTGHLTEGKNYWKRLERKNA